MTSTLPIFHADTAYDVVICGGGLAGAALARQLRLSMPDLSVLVLDRVTYPVPKAAHKVGESTVEIAGFYLANVLQLREHMAVSHIPKLGLRYFWQNSSDDFAARSELGISDFSPNPSYQIDRGVLENDLFRLNTEAGIEIAQGAEVCGLELGSGDQQHVVRYKDGAGTMRSAACRWVVDALGRRRWIQQQLDLGKPPAVSGFNAAWFRVEGRLDLEDFVPDSNEAWHQRVPGRKRYQSTNHLMGPGYWIWLIPLSSGHTSVGVVASEQFHDAHHFLSLDAILA
jgi:2-polyprenyl-6-methoxyphenol hydroxylase-like FAD-dependent oxidoreductase